MEELYRENTRNKDKFLTVRNPLDEGDPCLELGCVCVGGYACVSVHVCVRGVALVWGEMWPGRLWNDQKKKKKRSSRVSFPPLLASNIQQCPINCVTQTCDG